MRLSRLAKMGPAEAQERATALARNTWDRARASVRTPSWRRESLISLLSPDDTIAVRAAAARGRWRDAHLALARAFVSGPMRFVIAPSLRHDVATRVQMTFPSSARDAHARADRILHGDYDLLGYEGLRFEGAHGVDWAFDPVSGRRPPHRFWTDVPFLDAACGDHKVIWELNRHQHWLRLGRAYWLTGDTRYRDLVVRQLDSWLAANPPLIGVNWASMLELGFRSLSWLWAIQFFADGAEADETPWLVDALVALDRQLNHIARNLSVYFSPNTHLLGEALALYVAGRALPFLAASREREDVGRRWLLAESHRQIAADGSHREQSPHYHRYTLDFYLLALAVARITGDDAAGAFADTASRLATAAQLMADHRGMLPHIGDDDGGALLPLTGRRVDDARDSLAIASALLDRPELRIGDMPEEAYWMLAHPRLQGDLERSRRALSPRANVSPSASLSDTGYYVSRSYDTHLVVDAGPHGYLNGGHAHADALSMTLTVADMPLLIDPGTGCYTSDRALRDRMRSSALHNTVTLDERSQSIVAGPFHWSHTAAATAHRWCTGAGFDYLEASHGGYAPVVHRRHVVSLHDDLIVVVDRIEGHGRHQAHAHWHIDPGWNIELTGTRGTLSQDDVAVDFTTLDGRLERFAGSVKTPANAGGLGWHAPIYGRLEPSSTLRITQFGELPFWLITTFGLDRDNAVSRLDLVPARALSGAFVRLLALRINRRQTVDLLVIGEPRGEAPARWEAAGISSNARMLFCRGASDATHVAMVDGTAAATTTPKPMATWSAGRSRRERSNVEATSTCVA